MTQVTLSEAQQRLPELLAAAEAGEQVEIRAEDGRTFRLAPAPTAPSGAITNPLWPGYPQPGSAKGLIDVPADFDEPLDELKEYME